LRPVAHAGAVACPACGRRFAGDRYALDLNVCSGCGHHARVSARQRVEQLGDQGSIEYIDMQVVQRDPLRFDDGMPYPRRLAAARDRTGLAEAILAARATIDGTRAVIAAMDFDFLGGSLGSATGELFAGACECAAVEGRALIAVCVSGGARMQEGIASLAQMARGSSAIATVADARLPYISVLADPCFGGVTASFAVQADIILAEPGARIGFAGGRVIEQAAHERLPDGFQTAEFLLAHGMVDAVVDRRDLRATLATLLNLYTRAA
jgi:acetyl-CoA carboxylase carboxyl transferase subunit beta